LSDHDLVDIRAGKAIKYELAYNFDVIKSKNLYETTREGICFLECFINPTFNQNKEITGYIVHINEITERKNAEELLAKQTKELLEVNATKDKFMSIIAHDLKSPFNAIIGFSDLMLKNFDQLDQDTFLKGLQTIESASTHAYKLLENLLIWSQNQTGKSQFNPEKLNLKAQINESLKMVESAAISKKIEISVSVRKDLYVFADKNMFDSILRNLISNAIKFSFKGGRIKVSATKFETEIQISVSDKGIGISPERQSAIFEIDKYTNTSGTENELGTGLGLILCKDFIAQHKGKIWIESTPQAGTLVSFSLPLK
jgi:signal transduction histidine kinase